MPEKVLPCVIMIAARQDWHNQFSRVKPNKTPVSGYGWFLLKGNNLTLPKIFLTMTDGDKIDELRKCIKMSHIISQVVNITG